MKIYTKFSIGFTLHFELAILHWKPIQIVQLQINWFLSAAFSYWESIQIFHWSKRFHSFALVDHRHFSIDIAIYLKLLFCIENQWKFFYWKSIDFPASKTTGFPFTFYIGIFKYIFLLILLYFWNCHFCLLKINWFASFKNIRISLYFLHRDFQIHSSFDLAIL